MKSRNRLANLQKLRAGMAFRDERYDRDRAKNAHTKATRMFYTHEANIDHYWGMRRLKSAKSGKLL